MSEQIEKKNNEKREIPVVTPKVDIMETETIVYLVAEMPGVSEKNVDIDLQGNNLTIRGSTVPDSGQTEPTRSEYYPEKAYERQFTFLRRIGPWHECLVREANLRRHPASL